MGANLPIHHRPHLNAHASASKIPLTNNLAMLGANDWDIDTRNFNNNSPQQAPQLDDFNFNANLGMNMNGVGGEDFTWEMIGLGLEEPLPPQETIDELHQIYFEKVHPSVPMIHKYRYLAAMNLCVFPTPQFHAGKTKRLLTGYVEPPHSVRRFV